MWHGNRRPEIRAADFFEFPMKNFLRPVMMRAMKNSRK